MSLKRRVYIAKGVIKFKSGFSSSSEDEGERGYSIIHPGISPRSHYETRDTPTADKKRHVEFRSDYTVMFCNFAQIC